MLFVCHLCKREFDTNRGLLNHINKIHNISIENYYILEHGEGKCKYCENKTKFISLIKGYKKFCNNDECIKKNYSEAAQNRNKIRFKNHSYAYDKIKERHCIFCGKLFKPIKRNNARFCSKRCIGLSQKFKNSNEHENYIKNKNSKSGFENVNSIKFICPITNITLFINSKSGTLKKHLKKYNLDIQNYFEKYLPEYICRCKYCGEIFKYNFNLNKNIKPFCCESHYHKHRKDFPECYPYSEEKKLKQSILIKDKILNGEFTPCITNSWANSRSKIQIENINYKFRSTWEALFFIKNPSLKYEFLRIKYFNYKDNKNHIYIVDFIDEINKITYEIKPSGNFLNKVNQYKMDALNNWAKINSYKVEIVSENYFINNLTYYINNDIVLKNEKLLKSIKYFEKEKKKYEMSILF